MQTNLTILFKVVVFVTSSVSCYGSCSPCGLDGSFAYVSLVLLNIIAVVDCFLSYLLSKHVSFLLL